MSYPLPSEYETLQLKMPGILVRNRLFGKNEVRRIPSVQPYLTQSVFKVVLEKSIPTQIRQLILNIGDNKG